MKQQYGLHSQGLLVFEFFLLIIICLPGAVIAQTPNVEESADDGNATILAVFEPFRQAVISGEVSSRIERIHKEMGQGFNRGEPLVTLNSEDFVISLKKTHTLLKAAETNHKSISELFEDKSVSLLELNKVQTERALAELNLAKAERDLAACILVAPYAGRIKKVIANEHEWISAGQILLEIVDDSILRARALTPWSLLSKIHVGDTVTIKVNNVDMKVSGEVSHISPVIDSASQTSEILIEVDNRKGHLKSGMTGIIALP